MADPNLSERQPHAEAEELLPWYATGQLDATDRARVERHLYACAACREQLAVERRLMDEFRSMTPEVDSGWTRLKARIEPPRPERTAARPGFFEDLRALLSQPAVAALGAAQLAILAFGGLLLSLSQPAYHTLSSAPTPQTGNVIVMFRADTTIDEVRAAVRSAQGSIVGGPTEAGAYLLHVAPRQRQSAIARLHANTLVQLAEPIDGSSS